MSTDFVGFTFDGIHSSELNIYRVADGDRYEEQLLPEIDDKTVEGSGVDGVYYYGSFYKKKDFSIKIAFDSVTEEQYRNIRRLFGQKKQCKLIFDERPYKVYYVKIANPISLETICFDEQDYEWVAHGTYDEAGNLDSGDYVDGSYDHKVYLFEDGRRKLRRIYKGEGTIELVAYDPFARQRFKTLEEYKNNGIENIDEWSASSGILGNEEYTGFPFDVYQDITADTNIKWSDKYNGKFNVYNPGDIDVPYFLFIPYILETTEEYVETTDTTINNSKTYYIENNGEYEVAIPNFESGTTYYERETTTTGKIQPYQGDYIYISTDNSLEMVIEPFVKGKINPSIENGILINTRAQLIEGVQFDYITRAWRRTGNIYNKYIKEGSFGRIYKGDLFDFRRQGIYLNCAVDSENAVPIILYNYLYF